MKTEHIILLDKTIKNEYGTEIRYSAHQYIERYNGGVYKRLFRIDTTYYDGFTTSNGFYAQKKRFHDFVEKYYNNVFSAEEIDSLMLCE